MKIDRIIVQGFLGATSVDVDTSRQRIHLFAGQNGAGKSSIRDGVALALTADLGRVSPKKEAGRLVHDGDGAARCEVLTADGDVYAVSITGAGKIVDSHKGRDPDTVMGYVLDAQRFARLTDTERRAFLFGLMDVKCDSTTVRQKLVQRGCDGPKIDRVLTLLRAGFPAACEEAKSKATAAKGAWRAVTGETFGSEKAKTWAAAVPPHDPKIGAALAVELQHADVAIGQWQQSIGSLQVRQQHRATIRAKLPALDVQAGMIERIQTKLATDEAALRDAAAALQAAQAAAGAGPRVGLVHDLATALSSVVGFAPEGNERDEANAALDAYEREHGRIGATGGDPDAQARLPELTRQHALMLSAVDNDRRDLAAAQRAQAEAQAIDAELAEPFDAAELDAARQQVATLQAQRAEVVKKLDVQKSVRAQVEAAAKKTEEAAAHAADVAGWDGIAQALAPDGIPGELLAAALKPVNERLAQSAADAQWQQAAVGDDMAVTYGGRAYALISESERWRCDAMLAEAVASLSGARLLVLDRGDVLDLQGRADLIEWLDVLADNGEVDTVLLFMTLKQPPTGLPESFGAHWVEAGVCVAQAAEEVAA